MARIPHVGPLLWCYDTGMDSPQAESAELNSVRVKDMPGDVHHTLRRRAADAGQSLQEYILRLLCEQARTPTLEEVLERADSRTGGDIGAAEAVAAVRSERGFL